MDCLFCKIVAGDIPSLTLYEDDYAKAFLDVKPLTLGHAVVIPKEHEENILDLKDDAVAPVFLAVKHVTGMLKKTFALQGFTIGINHGRVGGQIVDHLHVHIIPRREGDGGGSIHSVVNDPPEEDLTEVFERIINTNQ